MACANLPSCIMCDNVNPWYIILRLRGVPEVELPLHGGDYVCRECAETLPAPYKRALAWISQRHYDAYARNSRRRFVR
jgi:hypothetical protein